MWCRQHENYIVFELGVHAQRQFLLFIDFFVFRTKTTKVSLFLGVVGGVLVSETRAVLKALSVQAQTTASIAATAAHLILNDGNGECFVAPYFLIPN